MPSFKTSPDLGNTHSDLENNQIEQVEFSKTFDELKVLTDGVIDINAFLETDFLTKEGSDNSNGTIEAGRLAEYLTELLPTFLVKHEEVVNGDFIKNYYTLEKYKVNEKGEVESEEGEILDEEGGNIFNKKKIKAISVMKMIASLLESLQERGLGGSRDNEIKIRNLNELHSAIGMNQPDPRINFSDEGLQGWQTLAESELQRVGRHSRYQKREN